MEDLKYNPNFFCQFRPYDVERFGLYSAIILGFLYVAREFYGRKSGGKFYCTLKDISDVTGLGLTTVKKYVPTEEMGWKHYSGYKPGTLEKTTWWEPTRLSERSSGDRSIERSSGDRSIINKNINKESGRTVATLPSPAHTPSTFPLAADSGAATEEGGVVKITTPPAMVDMKKKQTANDKRKKEFEFCQELLTRMGVMGAKAGGMFHKRIMQLKAQGYDDETLRLVANEAKTARLKDEFYAEPMKAFSESGVSGLLGRIEKRKAKKDDDGWSIMDKQGYYV